MKAYSVFPGGHPADNGCLLVFAPTRGRAIAFGQSHFWDDCPYTEMRAWRVPDFDGYAGEYATEPYCYETNQDLAAVGMPAFYDDEV